MRDKLRETAGRTVAAILLGGTSTTATDAVPRGSSRQRQGMTEGSVPVHYDLLKLDGDGPEGGWMRALDTLLSTRAIKVDSITLEGNHLDEITMSRFQRAHGFQAYRLDIGDECAPMMGLNQGDVGLVDGLPIRMRNEMHISDDLSSCLWSP